MGFSMARKKVNGFTLLELVSAVVIIGIISVAIYLKGFSPSTYDLNSISEQLKQDVRYTQILSMSLEGGYNIQLNNTHYHIRTPSASVLSTVALPSGVTIGTQNIQFDAQGSPVSGTTITVTTLTGTRALTLRPQTGFIDG